MAKLTRQQVQQFEDEGYLHIPEVIDPGCCDGLIEQIGGAVETMTRQLHDDGRITNLHEDAPFDTRWQKVLDDLGEEQPLRSWNRQVWGRQVYDLISHRGLVDVAASLLGPDVVVGGNFWVRPKVPGDMRTTIPWHQDSNYFGEDTAELKVLSVWLPLVDVNADNGCLQLIGGSHKWGLQASEYDEEHKARKPAEGFDPTTRGEAKTIDMKVGDVLVFTNLTYHRSLMNVSDHTRWSIDLRFHITGEEHTERFDVYPGFVVHTEPDGHAPESFEAWEARWTDALAANPNT